MSWMQFAITLIIPNASKTNVYFPCYKLPFKQPINDQFLQIISRDIAKFCTCEAIDAEKDLDLDLPNLLPAAVSHFSTTTTSQSNLLRVLGRWGISCVIEFLHGGRPPWGRKKLPQNDLSLTCIPSLRGSHSVAGSRNSGAVWTTFLPVTPGRNGELDAVRYVPKQLLRRMKSLSSTISTVQIDDLL